MQALACGTAAALLPGRRAFAMGDHSKFTIAQLAVTGGNWDPRPTALRRLLWEVDKRTSVDTALESVQVKLEAEKLHQTPFLCLAGDRAFAMPAEKELITLRRFLTFGGFLLVDSAEGRIGGDFDASVRRLVDELFPRPAKGFEPLPADHVIYKSFYLIERAVGRLDLQPSLEALSHDGRAAIVYSQNDLLGAWARDNYGTWTHECYPGGERQREMAFRLGVNLVMYALCLDYKTDQVHVPFIMKRRRWKPDDEL
jgi:Domain of unknown function (DUF4159)